MNGYQEVDGVYAKEVSEISLDCLILDVDGVLIDVTESFRRAIVDTVQFYFEKVIKVTGAGTLMTLRDTQSFKNSEGFNNDWDLTKAAVLFFLSKMVGAGNKDITVMAYQGEPLFEFLTRVKENGQGLDAAKDTALDKLGPLQKREVLGLYNPVYIQKIFQELYAGTGYCKRLYGFDPKLVRREGLINKEKTIVDKNLVKGFKNVAILTGRTREETDMALTKTGLGSIVNKENILFDSGKDPVKPDPRCLSQLCSKMNVTSGIYIGDTVDDARLVANYNAQATNGRFSFAAVTARLDLYFNKADIIADETNKILRYLREKAAI